MAVNKPWWATLEAKMFTVFKSKMRTALISDFPNLYCTASPMTKSASKFPTAYFRMVDWVEQGNDIDNTDTHGILATVQVDVIANTSLNDCKTVMYETINILKSMRFSIIAMPIYTSENNLYRGIVRCRRPIGADDEI